MERDATVAFPLLIPFGRTAARHGQAAAAALEARATELLSQAGVGRQERAFAELRVPHALVVELLELAIEVTGDRALALHAGACVEIGDFGVFEYLLRSCATLGEAFEVGAEHIAILHDAATVEIADGSDSILWRHHLELEVENPPGVHEFVMASFMTAVRRIVQADVSPIAVHFIHDAPDYRAEYEALFRAPCLFGADYNAFVIPREAAQMCLPTADAALFRMMKRQAGALLDRLPRRQPFRSRVRDAIVAELAANGAGLKSVARKLELSQSTLRRRLRERGITYSALVDEVRRERARELLASSEASLEAIALETGFSHATALHRAFRRWFGVTPERFRKAQTANTRQTET